ncbi:hypothetical protein [Bordetella sp. BOR01]|uniref:hypothetical protein n=1 Tax=Bordetella sp. BOR01 TaxID=2854779 RepID=UPI001C467AA7|nr:hypothetical protein [Bordetella sp. BOR01]MBV7485831.1 hypothetical protein [Bordetella sp. BOR01]
MNIAKGVRIGDYRIHCDVVESAGGQYRLVVASYKEGRPDTERAWHAPDWEPYSQLAEAQQRAVSVLKSIKRVGAAGEPLYSS